LKKCVTAERLRSRRILCFDHALDFFAGARRTWGILVAFNLVADNSIGGVAPAGNQLRKISVSTAIPWIGGIAIGVLASTSEEFLFRLFAIPYLQNLTKSRVLAVVLAAFSWGFLHTHIRMSRPTFADWKLG